MLKKIVTAAAVFAVIAGAPTLATAEDKPQAQPQAQPEAKPQGEIIAVAEGVADVKGADGKMYQVKVVDVIGEDLKTGDIVEYELVGEMPMKVKKQKGAKAPATK